MQLAQIAAFWLRFAGNILLDLFLYGHRFCFPVARTNDLDSRLHVAMSVAKLESLHHVVEWRGRNSTKPEKFFRPPSPFAFGNAIERESLSGPERVGRSLRRVPRATFLEACRR